MPLIQQLTSHQLLRLGLEAVGFDVPWQRRTNASVNLQRFRASFGAGPGACASIFSDLQTTAIADARITKPNSFYFLVAINWLATYKKEAEIAGYFKADEKTLRLHIKKYVNAIAALKLQKIAWQDLDDHDEIFAISVDGVHCRIYEPRKQPSARWCSHKFKQAGVSYEIGLAVYTSQVVWIAGPFQAADHDLTTYQKPNGLRSKVPAGKKVIADRGYKGEDVGSGQHRTLSIRNRFDTKEVKEFKRRVRAHHKSFNARIKSFKILKDCCCHGVKRHKAAFEAVCVICQYDMENGHPLFAV
jgi:hypothetical protein